MAIRDLISLRDEFTRQYRKPARRFVSVGFTLRKGSPRLSVLVNRKFKLAGLPKEYKGVPVDARYSPPARLAVGFPHS